MLAQSIVGNSLPAAWYTAQHPGGSAAFNKLNEGSGNRPVPVFPRFNQVILWRAARYKSRNRNEITRE
jgi:hypothetical protein